MMDVLVTGAAGFIGSELVLKLLKRGDRVIGIDNLCDYYDISLKKARLERHYDYTNYTHVCTDIANMDKMADIYAHYKPQRVVNLAAQVGVRYSLINPSAYIESNLVGFANVLEQCKLHKIEHLVYASSSSVYGGNTKFPYSEDDNVDHPLSLYAATKKADELMAHTYSHLFGISTIGLRFFTVYGPWGRPDMAPMLFTKAILGNKPINIFNNGELIRDFTFIDNIVEGITRVLDKPLNRNSEDLSSRNTPYNIFNIGNKQPIKLMAFIETLENILGKKAKKNMMSMQLGDVYATQADTEHLYKFVGFKPKTSLKTGLEKFVKWYHEYYRV